MDGEHNLFTCKGCTWLLDIDVPSHGFITFSRKQAVCRHRSKFTLVVQTNPCLHHTPVYIRLRYRVNDTVHATGLIEIPFWSQLIGSRSCRVLLIMTFIRRANPTLACWRAKLESVLATHSTALNNHSVLIRCNRLFVWPVTILRVYWPITRTAIMFWFSSSNHFGSLSYSNPWSTLV